MHGASCNSCHLLLQNFWTGSCGADWWREYRQPDVKGTFTLTYDKHISYALLIDEGKTNKLFKFCLAHFFWGIFVSGGFASGVMRGTFCLELSLGRFALGDMSGAFYYFYPGYFVWIVLYWRCFVWGVLVIHLPFITVSVVLPGYGLDWGEWSG